MNTHRLIRALALAGALLGMVLLVGSLTDSPRPPASPPPSATPSIPSISMDLERVSTFPGPDGSAVTAVTAGGPGFVAVGFDGVDRAKVWVSADGIEWKAVPDSDVFANASMAGVTSTNGRLIAVGRDLTSVDDELAAAWTSRDGVAWRRVVSADLGGAQMIGVVPAGPGFVAVGTMLEGVDASAVWTSVDGESWNLVPPQADLARSSMWSVATGGPGLVATGWYRNPEPSVAFWTSLDGRSWARSAQPSNSEGFQGRSVVDADGTLLAVGDLVIGGAAALWSSPDGVTWRRVPGEATFEGASLTAIARIQGGFIAGGYKGIDAAVWTSADGETWTRLDDPRAFRDAYITGMVTSDDRLVAVGATQARIPGSNSFDQAATAWFSAPILNVAQ
jgi:hypothetical protein